LCSKLGGIGTWEGVDFYENYVGEVILSVEIGGGRNGAHYRQGVYLKPSTEVRPSIYGVHRQKRTPTRIFQKVKIGNRSKLIPYLFMHRSH